MMSTQPSRFLFLVLKEHPFGREMLRRLLEAGFRPRLILEEDSRIATVEREKFLRRIEGHPLPPPIAELASAHDIEILSVPSHTDRHCLKPIRAADPRLMVLGGTRILRGEILEFPEDGVLNSHPGLLPECRGSASPAWSVYHDIPIGTSCHFCSPAIDRGDVVGRRVIPVRRGDRYEDLCFKTLRMAAVLMTEALEAYSEGRLSELRQPQGESAHPTFRNMSDELLEVVRRKLREQTYAHYSN